jgi:uncharacterized membrane protein
MALDPVVNFFQSEIATLPVSDSGVTIVISSGDGAKLPNPAVDGAFNLTIYKEGDPFASPEIVRVTARSTDTLTVTRAQEGSIATTKTEGSTWKVVMFPTAKTIQDIDSTKVNVADIVDNLTSTDTNKPLSANQGKVLQDGKVATASIVNDLTSGGTTVPLSAEQGKVLQDGKVAKAGDTMTGTLTATKLIPSGNVTAGNGMYLPATNQIAFSTNGAERVRVNASGDVGIGATNLVLPNPGFGMTVGNGSQMGIGHTDTASGVFYQYYLRNGTIIGSIVQSGTDSIDFNTSATSSLKSVDANTLALRTNSAERMRITSAGDVGIGTTAPASKLHVTGLTRSTSGINFNASGGNTLSSYEEGNWTAALRIAGNSITTQTGKYTKIGNFVHVNVVFIASFTASDGLLTITGLPFSVLTADTDIAVGSVHWRQVGSGVSEQVSIIAQKNTTTLEFVKATSTGTDNNVNAAELLNLTSSFSNYIFATITYRTT